MDKEKWIADILQSAKGIQPVPSNPFMANRIESALKGNGAPGRKISAQWVYLSVAAMLVVISLNIMIWKSSEIKRGDPGIEQVIHDYGFNNNDLYSFDYSN